MIRKIEIERFSLTPSKRFDEVVAGVNTATGHPDMAEFVRSTYEARSFAELKSAEGSCASPELFEWPRTGDEDIDQPLGALSPVGSR
jgi:hypothetical protein